MPFSAVGAIWLMYFLGYNWSIAVWVGLIALAGLDAETGVVMLLYLDIAYERWKTKGKMTTWADLTDHSWTISLNLAPVVTGTGPACFSSLRVLPWEK